MTDLHKEVLVALFLCLLLLSGVLSETPRRLHKTIRHYEHLHYNHGKLLYSHHRLRRSSDGPRELELQFSAFGKEFDLRLVPSDQYLHKKVGLYVDGKEFPRSKLKPFLYMGRDINDTSSHVYGSMAFGVFDGTIHTENEIYHLEPSERYLDPSEAESHSVIYRHSDADLSELYPSTSGTPCAASFTQIRRNLAAAQHMASKPERDTLKKRQTIDSNLVRCWLNVIGDSYFYNEVTSSGDSVDIRTAQAMSLMRNYVAFGSQIFETTDWLGNDQVNENIQFGIRDISISTSVSEDPPSLQTEFLGVEAYLTRHSEANYNDYCLAYRFTARDFDGGVLGLAYVASETTAGGICDIQRNYGGTMRTQNTGIVTVVNFGQRVPTLVTSITFTHEAGHNFGSQHDPTTDPSCVPSESAGGNYIMFASASDGNSPNNVLFSPCSRDYIGPIIQNVGQAVPGGCFVDGDDMCGNSLVDQGEDCDCGGSRSGQGDLCPDDPCCNATTCLLANSAICSPQQLTGDGEQAICCNASTCDYVPVESNFTCRSENECAFSQICNGSVFECPASEPKQPANDTIGIACNDGANYCVDGECTGSICIPLELNDCECTAEGEECDVCCELNGVCTSTFTLAMMEGGSDLPNGEGQNIAVGKPCSNFTGYCDFLNNCQPVDSEGALTRLTDFLLNTVVTTALEWIANMWWAVLLIIIGILLILFFIVLGCHFLLPRPEHVRKRSERRRSIRTRSMRRNRPIPMNQQYASPQGYY